MSLTLLHQNARFLLLAILLFQVACGSSTPATEPVSEREEHVYYDIDDQVEEDEEMLSHIQPHVREMRRKMDRVLTHSEGSFERGRPEGSLGNLSADIVRYRATAELREKVDVSVMNNGGLRAPLPEGEITVGMIYELMPFENYIAALRFTGDQLKEIADELAAVNGEAVSGLRFRIVDGKASDVLVDSMAVDSGRSYWVATNNWMADGGGASPTLWEPLERIDLDVLIRDAIIEYLGQRDQISPFTDQRIRNGS